MINIKDLKSGDIVWTNLPVVEGFEQSIISKPKKPRKVKVNVQDQNFISVHAFNEDSGVIDFDSNATSYPYKNKNGDFDMLYLSELDSLEQYKDDALSYINEIEFEVRCLRAELKREFGII